MITNLRVKNLAVVEALELSFERGMSVVTGETGAGKSILLQALSLVLGTRADSSLIRHGKDRADIGAVFAVENQPKVQAFLQTQSLNEAGEENACILRRVLSADGKSKAFVNGNPVPLSTMRDLGDLLIDIYGQNEHQLLLRPDQQLALLDDYAQLCEEKTQLNLLVKDHKLLKNKIDDLQNNQSLALQQQELYQHQLDELLDAQLTQDELDSIESDFKTSTNAQALIEKTSAVLNQLEGDEGVNSQLLHLNHQLSQALAMDDKLFTTNELLNSAQLQVQEVIYELSNYHSHLSIDDEACKTMEARITELHDLGRKHNCQIQGLLSVQALIESQLEAISFGANAIDELEQNLESLSQQYQINAGELSSIRHKKAQELSNAVTEVMQVLGMPGSEFQVALPAKVQGVQLNGNESVEFLVKTNMGQSFKPLKKVASGGELSRISLAISVIISDSEYTPTLIFDEVDVGISGAVAEVVGKKLKTLANNYQVICITHLAQVAAFGHQHLRANKTQNRDGAQTQVKQLSDDERVDEIARILGGSTITDKARKAAQEMIELSTNT